MKQLNPKIIWKNFLTSALVLFFAFLVLLPLIHLFRHFFLWSLVVYLLSLVLVWFLVKLSYHFYKYELGDRGLNIEKGIISKKYVTIPYSKIQNVNIYRSLLDRIMGLSSVYIETAGFSLPLYAQKSEGNIPGLSMDTAQSLRDELIKELMKYTNKFQS